MDERERQIIRVKIEYTKKQIEQEETKSTPNYKMIDKWNENILIYERKLREDNDD